MAVSVINFFRSHESNSTSSFYFVLPTIFGVDSSVVPSNSIYVAEFSIAGIGPYNSSSVGVRTYIGYWRLSASGFSVDTNADADNVNISQTGSVGQFPAAFTGLSDLALSAHRLIPTVRVVPDTSDTLKWLVKGNAWVEATEIY